MEKIKSKLNGNRFIPCNSEEMTALEMISNLKSATNEVIEELDQKVDVNGDFKGSWFGISRPEFSEPGIQGQVTKNRKTLEKTVLYATDFGIKGDGSNETEKLKEFLCNTPDNIILEFDFSNATFYIQKGLTLLNRNNVTIKGNGNTIKCLDSMIDDKYTTFPEGFGHDSIIKLMECSNIEIDNLIFDGSLDTRLALVGEESQDCCLLLLSNNKVKINKCSFIHGMTDGINLFRTETNVNKQNKDIEITNCYFFENRRNNLSIIDAKNVIVSNNHFKSGGMLKGVLPMSNICIEPDNAYSINYCPCSDVYIKDNIIEGGKMYNVMVSGWNAWNIHINHNKIINSQDCGLYIRNYEGTFCEVYARGNNIEACGGGVSSTYGNLREFSNNRIYACTGEAMSLFDIHSLKILDNDIIFNTCGINVNSATECYIKGNIIKDNATTTSIENGNNYSIRIVSITPTSNFQITNNYIVNSGSDKMQSVTVTNTCKGMANGNVYINAPDEYGFIGIIGKENLVD